MSHRYSVKELFLSLQGEGANTGRAAVFLRFSGCNLAGRAGCADWCDTDFTGTDGALGGRYESAEALASTVESLWPREGGHRWVVCTGGEPLLQLDGPLIDALHRVGFEIAVETNGTLAAPAGIDWLCVSPKAGAPLVQRRGDELKLVYPQVGLDTEALEGLSFEHFFLQPRDGPGRTEATRAAIEYCLHHPRWRLSLQTHKLLGIP